MPRSSGHRAIGVAATSLLAALSLALAVAPGAPGAPPDRAFKTPSSGAQAFSAISGPNLRKTLRRQLRRAGAAGGAFVSDPVGGTVLFTRAAGRSRQIASNMKLFTTAAVLDRFGPAERLETSLIAPGGMVGGVVQGDAILRGDGDPGLRKGGLARLASAARAGGLARISGRLRYDESIFDKRRKVPRKGIRGRPFAYVGRLSGLGFEGGRSVNPARSAALKAVGLLRKRGIGVRKKVARGRAPAVTPLNLIAQVPSAPMATLARITNTFSSNFYAETLLKRLAAEVRGRGRTKAGAAIVRRFAAEAGGKLRTQNGSGLSRADRASPRSVGALLAHMLGREQPVRDAFLTSLAVAGRTGTLARRMRGTAARGRCVGKTGTLSGVSAVSGYCEVAPQRFVVFSILMNKVKNLRRAQLAQDRMVSLIARYSP